MTVLTLPSTGLKPDKAPLVDHADANESPSPYDPKLLESGGGGGTPDRRQDRCGRWARLGARLLTALLACALLVWLTRDAYCRAYDDGTASASGLRRGPSVYSADDDDSAGDGDAPCKSYTSYAAAEDDMLSAMPAPDDYDAAGRFDAMEDVYKKLEDFALNDKAPADGGDPAAGRATPPTAAVVAGSARFIHDFSVNVTGIVDVRGRRCYVMPLVRDAVSPPASLYDLLFKMSSGYYSMDVAKVVADMRVVRPALKDLSGYGLYISKDCAGYSTFRLEKAVSFPADA